MLLLIDCKYKLEERKEVRKLFKVSPIPRPDAEKGDEGGGDKEEMETLMNGNSEEGVKGGDSNGEVHVLSGTKTSKIEVKKSRRIHCVSSFALPCFLVFWCAFNLVKAANWSVHPISFLHQQ